jgi:hypothetical protein
MVTPALRKHFLDRGVPLISLEQGAKLLVGELQSGGDDIALVLGAATDESALLGDRGVPSAEGWLHVNAATVPELDGHRVKGDVVVPVAFAIEWFVRAARACRPDLTVVSVDRIEVRRGIRLADYDTGIDLIVAARQLENGNGSTVAVELRGLDGSVRYAATVRLERVAPVAPVAPGAPSAPATDPWEDRVVYDGRVVFHGESFQVIQHVGGMSENGATARLDSRSDKGWTDGPWAIDPAALDGALQLGVLWTERVLDGGNLPTEVSSVRLFGAGAWEGPIDVVLQQVRVRRDDAVYDAVLLDWNGRRVAELRGVKHHRLPGEASARTWSPAPGA